MTALPHGPLVSTRGPEARLLRAVPDYETTGPLEACAAEDPDVMFPDFDDEKAVAAARRVCARCPFALAAECAAGALARREEHGVWGGQTARELASGRRSMYRKRARSEAQSEALLTESGVIAQ